MRKILFAAMLSMAAMLPASLMAASQADVQKELQSLQHQIVYINTFGSWQQGSMKGVHRLILVDAKAPYPHSKLYLQWISQDKDGDAEKMVAVKAVDEINLAAVYLLSVPKTGKEGISNNTLNLSGVNQYAHTMHSFGIVPSLPGEYRFSYGDTKPAGTDSRNVGLTVERAVCELPVALDYYARPTF